MMIDHINLNHLRIFEVVYRTRSMTLAAEELHLTQSGVSQHIKSFEEVLGVTLFDRIKQKLVPTAAATQLFDKCSQSLLGIEQILTEVKGGETQLGGTVNVGMPIEFGNNVLLPFLAQFGLKHPRVRFNLRLGFAQEMNEGILNGDLDFAFVDSIAMDKRVTLEKVYDELLDLCVSPELLKKYGPPKNNRKYFEALDYIEYQKDAPILNMWFEHHLGVRHPELKIKATVLDAQAIARFILSQLGVGLLPHHLTLKLEEEGQKLYLFKGCGKPLKNAISVAYLRERTQSPAAAALLQWLKDSVRSHEGK